MSALDAVIEIKVTADGAIALFERAQRIAVHNAIAAGCSWQQVGDALGISRQAAHQKFGPTPIHQYRNGVCAVCANETPEV